MRHDKEAFASNSIKSAKDGTYIADILRIIYYSYYAKLIPGGIEKAKNETYPFTGSYISQYPFTLSYLRFFVKLLELYNEGEIKRADSMLELGINRITSVINELEKSEFLKLEYIDEKEAWDLYYDEIEKLTRRIELNEIKSINKQRRIKELLLDCKINL